MRITDRRAIKRGFGVLQMMYWCTFASFTTFFVAFATDIRGVTDSQIGVLLAVFMLSGGVGQFCSNALCDKFQFNRKAYMAILALMLALYFAIYFSPNFAWMTAFYLLLGFALAGVPSLLDTWIIRELHDEPEAYGPIRSMASIAFAFLVLLLGFLITRFGYAVTLVSACVCAAGGIVTAYRMPEIPHVARKKRHETATFRFSSIQPMVWALIGASLLWGMAHIPMIQMVKLVMERLGGTVFHMSIAIFANALAEFPLMQYTRRLMRFSPESRLAVAGVIYVLSTFFMFLANSPALFIAMTAFNGAAYGLLLPARRQIIADHVPARLHNRMHGVVDATSGNAGGVLGNLLAGSMLQYAGARMMLGVCALLHTGSLFVMLGAWRLGKKGVKAQS